jgi:hypothetical protein
VDPQVDMVQEAVVAPPLELLVLVPVLFTVVDIPPPHAASSSAEQYNTNPNHSRTRGRMNKEVDMTHLPNRKNIEPAHATVSSRVAQTVGT